MRPLLSLEGMRILARRRLDHLVRRVTGWRRRLTGTAALGLKVAGVCALALWSSRDDPLGFDAVTDAFSRDIFNRVFAPEYQGRRDKVVVVLVTDRTLDTLDATWPLSGALHGRVLTEILASAPRALFMDFLFVDQRAGWSARPIVSARDEFPHIPVFLAAPPPGSGARLVPDLRRAAEQGHVIPVSVVRELGPGDHYRYPLQVGGTPAAAFAMYRHLCGGGDRWDSCAEAFDPTTHRRRTLEIFWGGRGPDYRRALSLRDGEQEPLACADAPQSWWERAFRLALGDRDITDRCPYATTIFAEDLLRDPLRFEPVLRDAAVLYGASLLGNADVVVTPNAGPLPYVHTHAMALDNLLTYGHRHFGDSDVSGHLDADRFEQAVTIIVHLIMFAFVLWSARLAAAPPPAPPAAGRSGALGRFARPVVPLLRPYAPGVAYAAAVAVVLAALLYVEVQWLRLSPTNWVGILSLATIAEILITPGHQDPPPQQERKPPHAPHPVRPGPAGRRPGRARLGPGHRD